MADSLHVADRRKELKHSIVCHTSQPKLSLVASIPKHYSQNALRRIVSMDQNILGMGKVSEVGLFLLKLAVLEGLRRFSNAHCPFLWRSLQALQFVCVPPFKWIGKWGIFRGFLKCMQTLSRPLFLLSVATLSDGLTGGHETSECAESDSSANVASDSRSGEGVTQIQPTEEWILQLKSELDKEGIVLPERITEDELRRFYYSAHGDFARFLNSVKKTISWRKTFRFLSEVELEYWSEMVFWHGFDSKGRPCLIIRVAPACSNVISDQRSRLPEVVVSHIEHGILNLVPARDPRVTVLMDCDGLTPFRFPVQMMRSCVILLQDHYPNHLAALFIVRLPPVARMVMQTLFQVLRPGTRKKLRILGQDYQKVLSEQLQTLPSVLGGDCSCPKCSKVINEENNGTPELTREHMDEDILPPDSAFHADDFEFVKCNRVVKSIIIGLLVLLFSILYAVGFHRLEGLHFYRRGTF